MAQKWTAFFGKPAICYYITFHQVWIRPILCEFALNKIENDKKSPQNVPSFEIYEKNHEFWYIACSHTSHQHEFSKKWEFCKNGPKISRSLFLNLRFEQEEIHDKNPYLEYNGGNFKNVTIFFKNRKMCKRLKVTGSKWQKNANLKFQTTSTDPWFAQKVGK